VTLHANRIATKRFPFNNFCLVFHWAVSFSAAAAKRSPAFLAKEEQTDSVLLRLCKTDFNCAVLFPKDFQAAIWPELQTIVFLCVLGRPS
jgi:hypothetical protein